MAEATMMMEVPQTEFWRAWAREVLGIPRATCPTCGSDAERADGVHSPHCPTCGSDEAMVVLDDQQLRERLTARLRSAQEQRDDLSEKVGHLQERMVAAGLL